MLQTSVLEASWSSNKCIDLNGFKKNGPLRKAMVFYSAVESLAGGKEKSLSLSQLTHETKVFCGQRSAGFCEYKRCCGRSGKGLAVCVPFFFVLYDFLICMLFLSSCVGIGITYALLLDEHLQHI